MVGRFVALYAAECLPATEEVERSLGVMIMKMLRWMAEVTLHDSICNEDIRQRFGIAPTADMFRESRLRWYGHVRHADDVNEQSKRTPPSYRINAK
ncbi:hypothetical protein Y032_0166g58 [Ancylostoma ceylanicum]|uniref:Uncharacterized protein n=1 Tax=Ancylostoma ceylanicum TaxID=53326 RepID=A0A016SWY9_9BILA|nr:hypothetical protein Y032_0166g58 [Ancylostoma ceylanicum]